MNFFQSQVINLKRRQDRLEKFAKECPLCIQPMWVFDAQDGQSFNTNEPDLGPELDRLRRVFCTQTSFKPGELGCWASHLALWTLAAQSPHCLTFIFEDDNQFSNDFESRFLAMKPSLKQVARTSEPCILYLGGGSLNVFDKWFPKKVQGLPSTRIPDCMQGYSPKTFNAQALNQSMANALLTHLDSCHSYVPVDNFMENFLKQCPDRWSQHVSPEICWSMPGWFTDIHTIPSLLGFSNATIPQTNGCSI